MCQNEYLWNKELKERRVLSGPGSENWVLTHCTIWRPSCSRFLSTFIHLSKRSHCLYFTLSTEENKNAALYRPFANDVGQDHTTQNEKKLIFG